MKKSRFTEAQFIGLLIEQDSGPMLRNWGLFFERSEYGNKLLKRKTCDTTGFIKFVERNYFKSPNPCAMKIIGR